MKYLYVCADLGIPILGAKGASVHVREFMNALMRQGHTVNLVCAKRGSGNEIGSLSITEVKPQADTVSPHYFATPVSVAPSYRSSIDARESDAPLLVGELKKLAYNLELSKALDRIIPEVRPDVIYERYALFGYAGTAAAHSHGLPHILEVNAPLIDERQAALGMVLVDLARRIEAQIFQQADAVITVSEAMREYVIEQGVKPDHAIVMPNGVDLDKFKPTIGHDEHQATNLQALGLPRHLQKEIVIGFVGSLKPWHGVDLLVQAFARARRADPRLNLLIVGEGPQLEHLRSEAQRQDPAGKIYFTGAVPHHLIPKFINLMDITVAPYRHQERFYFSPLKILEYMAMGKPVIATRQGQIFELIEDGSNGLLCETESVESLADALVRLARNSELRYRLGQKAAATVAERHDWLHIADRVTRLAESLQMETAVTMPTIGAVLHLQQRRAL